MGPYYDSSHPDLLLLVGTPRVMRQSMMAQPQAAQDGLIQKQSRPPPPPHSLSLSLPLPQCCPGVDGFPKGVSTLCVPYHPAAYASPDQSVRMDRWHGKWN